MESIWKLLQRKKGWWQWECASPTLGRDEKGIEHWNEVWLLCVFCEFPDKREGLANWFPLFSHLLQVWALESWRYIQAQECLLFWRDCGSCIKWLHRLVMFCIVPEVCCEYFPLYDSLFKLKSINVKHHFCCHVLSLSSLNRRHFLKKTATERNKQASCVLGPLPCPPAYSWWLSSNGAWQADTRHLCCPAHSLCDIQCGRGGVLLKEKTM